MKKVGINGLGRIGRTSLRVWWQFHRNEISIDMINTSGSMDVEGWANLVKYDTNYGPFDAQIRTEKVKSAKEAVPGDNIIGYIFLDDHRITITAGRDPAQIPWGENGIDTVLESTGVFTDTPHASAHLTGGAKKVIISAPAKDAETPLYVLGVKGDDGSKQVTSNASCTTNCAAPVMMVLSREFGIEKAMLNTTHAYTDDQNLQDNSHQDPRRSRNAAQNIIPTSTGAAKAVGEVVPAIKGIFDGVSMRVPVSTGSLSDMVMIFKRDVTIQEVNDALIKASENELKGILAVTYDPIVSHDIVGRRESSIVDLALTNVVGGNMVRVISWYDNEFGYCNRLIEQACADFN